MKNTNKQDPGYVIYQVFRVALIICLFIGGIGYCASCTNAEDAAVNKSQSLAPQVKQLPLPVTVKAYEPTQSNDTIRVKVGILGDNVQLFGMNVRFLYQSDKLTFLRFSEYAPGYGPQLPNPPRVNKLKEGTGLTLFNVTGNITFVNGAVQLFDPTSDIFCNLSTPTHYFTIEFKVINASECPIVILDKKNIGGGFSGSAGLVTTIVAQPGSGYQSAPTTITADHLNWISISNTPPYGHIDNDDCTNE